MRKGKAHFLRKYWDVGSVLLLKIRKWERENYTLKKILRCWKCSPVVNKKMRKGKVHTKENIEMLEVFSSCK